MKTRKEKSFGLIRCKDKGAKGSPRASITVQTFQSAKVFEREQLKGLVCGASVLRVYSKQNSFKCRRRSRRPEGNVPSHFLVPAVRGARRGGKCRRPAKLMNGMRLDQATLVRAGEVGPRRKDQGKM